jgi:hypothetical protein
MEIMKIKIVPLSILLLTFSCRTKEKNPFEISPPIFSDSNITLSEIADDIKYIPLDNYIPIGITYSIRIIDENIYLSFKDVGIVQYDRNGKYIRNIGRKGRGPGEYRYCMAFTVDDDNKRIYIRDNDKIKVYSHLGNFLRDLPYKEYISRSSFGLEILNSLLFIPDYILDGLDGDPKFNWIFLDTLGRLVSTKENTAHSFYPNYGITGGIYNFDNKLFYFNPFNDTIFSISSDLKYNVAYIFPQDAHRRPEGGFGSDPWSQLSSLFIVTKMFETKSFTFVEYVYQDKGAILLINKISKKTFMAYKELKKAGYQVSTRASIKNDLDGGLPVSLSPIYYYYVEDDSEYICSLLNSFEIKTYTSSNEFKDAVPKYPEKKRELEKLAVDLKETDNPVLMIVRLSK